MINDRYKIGDKIGSGAMGDVYQATDMQTGQTVAIKRLKSALVDRDPQMLERFRREGEALRQLDHPNIVKMLDTGEHEGSHYIVMEYVDGGDLHNLLTSPLAINKALTITIQIADALTRTHFFDILHRDIKPPNVLITADGTPKLTDFGIAAMQGDGDLTETGAIIGTIAYLSPEACMGQAIDKRSDIWSFGVLLYEMLIGKRPFVGDSTGATILSILQNPLPDMSAARPDIPDAVADLLYRMLDKNRDSRIPSVRLVGAEIEALLEGSSQPINIPQYASPQTVNLFATPTPITSEVKHNLPVQTTPFVGRTNEVEAVAAQLETCKLVTLLGPGGMGKSRLSIEIGQRFVTQKPDGVHFIPLAPLSNAKDIPAAIADVLDLSLPSEGDPVEGLVGHLQEKQMLFILDNYEHVMDGVGVVQRLLEEAPLVQVLATSRTRLNLGAECVFEVAGMPVPTSPDEQVFEEIESVQLFLSYAQRAQPGFELDDEDRAHVVDICRRVGGMPLALELAATWVRMLPPAEIAEELADDPNFLETDRTDLPARQRSMRAAFEYSWELLTEQERNGLMALSVFRGGGTRQAVRQVTGVTLRVLMALVDKSLLKRDPASGRFEIHELLRQFAAEKLEEAGEGERIHKAHMDYYLGWMGEHNEDMFVHKQLETLAAVEADWANIKAAWHTAVETEPLAVAQATEAMNAFTSVQGHYTEAKALFSASISVLKPLLEDPDYELLALRHMAYGSFNQVEQMSLENVNRFERVARAHGDPEIIVHTLMAMAGLWLLDPENIDPVASVAEAVQVARDGDLLHSEMFAAFILSHLQLLVPNLLQYYDYLKTALELGEANKNYWITGRLYMNLAHYHIMQSGDWDTARQTFEQSEAIARKGNQRDTKMMAQIGLLGCELMLTGDPHPLVADLNALRKAAKLAGGVTTEQQAVQWLTLAHLYEEDYTAAQRNLTDYGHFFREPLNMVLHPFISGIVNAAEGNDQAAADGYINAIAPFSSSEAVGIFTLHMPTAAWILHQYGESEWAAEVLSFAWNHASISPKWMHTMPVFARLSRELNIPQFNDAWERGKQLDAMILTNDLLAEFRGRIVE